jgi:RimJ/RimL family protein N-acetyltransferase
MRPATADDFDFLYRLHRTTLKEYVAQTWGWDEGRQRQGIGTSVIQQVLDEARRSGKPVALQVLKVNPARRLYERLGFSVTGENETLYFMKATV